MKVEEAADALRSARITRTPCAPFTDQFPMLDEDWGYAVQDADRERRLRSGERLIGRKLGLTSMAKQRTMGLGRPVVGFLTDAMLIDQDATVVDVAAQPRIEPEIAFRLGHDLDRPLRFWTAHRAVDALCAAAEVIDSRYSGYSFRLPDVLADNTSAAGVLLGEWQPLPDMDNLTTVGCVFSADGEVRHTATGAAILGHPLQALVHLSEHLARRGEILPAGAIVLAGALTDAVPAAPATTYQVEIAGIGTVELRAR